MSTKQIVYSLEDLPVIVEMLYRLMPHYKVFTFTGTLGAGKTTLVRELLRRAGVKDVITSPTFTYVNVYENDMGQTFYHFDAYRIKTLADFQAAGFDEYLYQQNSWAFIEWPEMLMPLLTHDVCHVKLEYAENKRLITIEDGSK